LTDFGVICPTRRFVELARQIASSGSVIVIARSPCDEAIQLFLLLYQSWIASRSLSSGVHPRDPLALTRDDGINP
jgi:hypothetical protein